jgi:serine protease Do
MKKSINLLSGRLGILALGVAALVVATTAAVTTTSQAKEQPRGKSVPLIVDERPIDRDLRRPTSFAPVVKEVGPSVVMVTTSTKVEQQRAPGGPWLDDPFFRRFFPDHTDPRRQRREFRAPRRHGVGSGVIVTKDGYILTNNHVVDDADEVKVVLEDGREFKGKVIGKDAKTDIAVLKIEASDLPAITMADSDQIEVGDLVLAVGNPFGIGQTVTMGIVSATGRATLGLAYEDFIQTDAAINPGNSGGALVDVEGRLIGINTAILSRSGGNQGIGFAIPTELARHVMESLITDGVVTRGYLGVMIQDVTPDLAREFGLKGRKGALIGDVLSGTPAAKSGLESGDVVIELDGKPVEGSRELRLHVARLRPGERVPVKVFRSGAAKTLNVVMGELPSDEEAQLAQVSPADEGEVLNGVGVRDLDADMRRQFRVPARVKGALVREVDPRSAAYEAGLRPGDVIVGINREQVTDARDAIRLTSRSKDRTTLLRLWRDGARRFIVVDESVED